MMARRIQRCTLGILFLVPHEVPSGVPPKIRHKEAMRKNTSKKLSTRSSNSSKKIPKPDDYQIVLQWSAEDQCYIATLPGWQNVKTHGDILAEASQNAHEVLALLIRDTQKRNQPFPRFHHAYSGNLRLRLPASLHGRLAQEAEREGVSLNQWLVAKLAS